MHFSVLTVVASLYARVHVQLCYVLMCSMCVCCVCARVCCVVRVRAYVCVCARVRVWDRGAPDLPAASAPFPRLSLRPARACQTAADAGPPSGPHHRWHLAQIT